MSTTRHSLLLTRFDSDDFGDNFSVGIGSSASESGLRTVIGHVISQKIAATVLILSERQEVEGAIV